MNTYDIRMKGHLTISVEDEVIKKAKEIGMNISAVTENAIKAKLGMVSGNIPIETADACQRCGIVEPKATRDNPVGMTWLSPDDIWICSGCLDLEIQSVLTAGGIAPRFSKAKRLEVMQLAREFVAIPEIRKDIAIQAKERITG